MAAAFYSSALDRMFEFPKFKNFTVALMWAELWLAGCAEGIEMCKSLLAKWHGQKYVLFK